MWEEGGAAGQEGPGREEFGQGQVIQTEPPSRQTELCFISLSFPASFQEVFLPSTPINSSL